MDCFFLGEPVGGMHFLCSAFSTKNVILYVCILLSLSFVHLLVGIVCVGIYATPPTVFAHLNQSPENNLIASLSRLSLSLSLSLSEMLIYSLTRSFVLSECVRRREKWLLGERR